MHRGAEHAEHSLMGTHIGELVRHMVLHQIMFTGQREQLRAFFGSGPGVEQRFQLSPAAKLRAELAPLGQKTPLAAAEGRTGRKAAGVFDLRVVPAGDFFVHASSSRIQKDTKRTPA